MFRKFGDIHGILTEKIPFFFKKSNYLGVTPKLINNGFMIDMPGFHADRLAMTVGMEKRQGTEKESVLVSQRMLEEQGLRSEKSCLIGVELPSLAEVWFRPRQDSFLVSVTPPIEAPGITTLAPGNPRSVPASTILPATIPVGLLVGWADKLPSRQYKARVGSHGIQ